MMMMMMTIIIIVVVVAVVFVVIIILFYKAQIGPWSNQAFHHYAIPPNDVPPQNM